MKKIFLALALVLFSAASWAAASITAPDIDFGTISIKGQTLPVTGSETVIVLTVSMSAVAPTHIKDTQQLPIHANLM